MFVVVLAEGVLLFEPLTLELEKQLPILAKNEQKSRMGCIVHIIKKRDDPFKNLKIIMRFIERKV